MTIEPSGHPAGEAAAAWYAALMESPLLFGGLSPAARNHLMHAAMTADPSVVPRPPKPGLPVPAGTAPAFGASLGGIVARSPAWLWRADDAAVEQVANALGSVGLMTPDIVGELLRHEQLLTHAFTHVVVPLPGPLHDYLLGALQLLQEGLTPAAIESLTALTAAYPQLAIAQLYLGMAHRARGDLQEALTCLRAAMTNAHDERTILAQAAFLFCSTARAAGVADADVLDVVRRFDSLPQSYPELALARVSFGEQSGSLTRLFTNAPDLAVVAVCANVPGALAAARRVARFHWLPTTEHGYSMAGATSTLDAELATFLREASTFRLDTRDLAALYQGIAAPGVSDARFLAGSAVYLREARRVAGLATELVTRISALSEDHSDRVRVIEERIDELDATRTHALEARPGNIRRWLTVFTLWAVWGLAAVGWIHQVRATFWVVGVVLLLALLGAAVWLISFSLVSGRPSRREARAATRLLSQARGEQELLRRSPFAADPDPLLVSYVTIRDVCKVLVPLNAGRRSPWGDDGDKSQ